MSENRAERATYRVLILEDRAEDAKLAEMQLGRAGQPCVMLRVETEETFRAGIEEFQPDVILCDYSLPQFDGHSALRLAKEIAPDLPVLMFTGSVNEEIAVRCLKDGADDYILKTQPARLHAAIRSAVEFRKVRLEQRQSLVELRESEERFRRLVMTANDAIVSFDSQGAIGFWNPAAVAIFGRSPREANGKDICSFLGGAGVEDLRQRMEEVAEELEDSPPAEPLMLTGQRADGTSFPVEVSLSAWRTRDGVLHNAIIRDTSERASAREALEALSSQYELLLVSAGEGIVGLDSEGRVIFANPVALDLLGRRVDELLGEKLHSLIHLNGPQLHLETGSGCPVLASLAEGTQRRAEDVFFRKDGTPLPVTLSSTPILKDDGVEGAVLIFEDITARKEQEDALRASEAQYRGLFEQATHGIYRAAPDGTFLAVNQALVEILGYDSEQDLGGLNLARDVYLNPEDRTEVLRGAEIHDRFMGFETQWRRKDGSPVTVSLSGRLIRTRDGRMEAVEILVEDLTERKVLEAQLRQAQKMEAVGQLTGGIAHDFNNVLSVILLNADLIIAALQEDEAVDVADLFAIRDAAQKASSITRKLLGFSRRDELVLEPIHLGEVVDGFKPMLRTLLTEEIELQLETGNGAETQVNADSGAIEQMILNLCANSQDAMPQGGRITIRVTTEKLDEEFCRPHPGLTPGRWVSLECSDTGVGMDAPTLGRVFEPFFTTKAAGSGTGLGMAMVYGLTKQQGGYITVASEPGEGTTTHLFFPVCEDEVVDPAREYDGENPHH